MSPVAKRQIDWQISDLWGGHWYSRKHRPGYQPREGVGRQKGHLRGHFWSPPTNLSVSIKFLKGMRAALKQASATEKEQQQQEENGNEWHPLHPSRNNSANKLAVWRDRLQSLRRTPTKTTASPGPNYAWKTITNNNNWTHNNWPVAHSIKIRFNPNPFHNGPTGHSSEPSHIKTLGRRERGEESILRNEGNNNQKHFHGRLLHSHSVLFLHVLLNGNSGRCLRDSKQHRSHTASQAERSWHSHHDAADLKEWTHHLYSSPLLEQ